jgi:hypothetical protein
MSKRSVIRALWTAALMAPLFAGVAAAAEVVAVRVGTHPTFTRVVFELDASAGYRIERRQLPDGAEALVVTLDASAAPRSLRSRSVMVERVELTPERQRTSAQIRLRKSPVRVKELILADPPRIVFDLVIPEAEQTRLAARPPAPSQAEAPPRPSERDIAEAPVTPPPAPPPLPVAEPEPVQAEAAPMETPPPPVIPPASEVAEVEPEPAPVADEAEAEPETVAVAPEEPPGSPAPPLPRAPLPPAPAEPQAEAAPERAPSPVPARARSMPARAAEPSWWERIDPVTAGGVAAGVLLLLLGLVLLLRRRGNASDIDVVALAEAEERQERMSAEDEGGFAMGDETVAMGAQPGPPSGPERVTAAPGGLAAGPGLFDDDSEKESETMDSESANLSMERGAAAASASGDTDVVRLVRELERRVAQLETRLDESIDARQRLERQVAAQSEELRVQRTAIARTQRALRSLNRGEEEQATEPALREPSK